MARYRNDATPNPKGGHHLRSSLTTVARDSMWHHTVLQATTPAMSVSGKAISEGAFTVATNPQFHEIPGDATSLTVESSCQKLAL